MRTGMLFHTLIVAALTLSARTPMADAIGSVRCGTVLHTALAGLGK